MKKYHKNEYNQDGSLKSESSYQDESKSFQSRVTELLLHTAFTIACILALYLTITFAGLGVYSVFLDMRNSINHGQN